ncbi:MAG TPA: phospho-N-acetylmuramoyl-pentapeptide-transferase [Anaerolineales bacterium]|nr:phospho-N-acetylmuramoyl-pentapeptide-transferase [Anaerolineales bacterium]
MQTFFPVALAGVSFMLTVIWGPPLLRILRYFKVGKQIRVEGPERHFSKLGTPTMGGVMIILPVVLITTLLNAGSMMGLTLTGRSVILPTGVLVGFGLLGAIDDWAGLRGKRRAIGLSARTKLIVQLVMALVAAIGLRYFLQVPEMYVPGIKGEILIGFWYIVAAVFLIVGFSNAINLTDGLDGLAGLISVTAFVAYGVIAVWQGQAYLARFCFTLVGAIFGFLWFNVHPAMLFMGDTGALALGATLAVVAFMTGQWVLLPLIGIIPVSITLSVILQVGYFRLTGGKRLFKMAPLQHHFELSGWSETQVVQRFWLISLLFALVGVALAIV